MSVVIKSTNHPPNVHPAEADKYGKDTKDSGNHGAHTVHKYTWSIYESRYISVLIMMFPYYIVLVSTAPQINYTCE